MNARKINHVNTNTQISFNHDGTAQCLWTDALPLHELGRLEIHCATNIEFNNQTQHWEVKDRKGRVSAYMRIEAETRNWLPWP